MKVVKKVIIRVFCTGGSLEFIWFFKGRIGSFHKFLTSGWTPTGSTCRLLH